MAINSAVTVVTLDSIGMKCHFSLVWNNKITFQPVHVKFLAALDLILMNDDALVANIAG